MDDQEFFDLALKVAAGRATEAELAELDTVLANRPELTAQFEKVKADTSLAKEVLPLLAAMKSSSNEFPEYARERLRTKVRQTLGLPQLVRAKPVWNWRWVLGLGSATVVVVVLVLLSVFTRPAGPIIQAAMLDLAGTTRGASTNEVGVLQQEWKSVPVEQFSRASQLKAWENNWPRATSRPVAKIIYDRAAGEVRVLVRSKGGTFDETFPVDNGLASVIPKVKAFLVDQGVIGWKL